MNYADEHQHHRNPAVARLFARAEALFALYLTEPDPDSPSAPSSPADRARWTGEVVRALYGRQDTSR